MVARRCGADRGRDRTDRIDCVGLLLSSISPPVEDVEVGKKASSRSSSSDEEETSQSSSEDSWRAAANSPWSANSDCSSG
jgi:hypothetical protein